MGRGKRVDRQADRWSRAIRAEDVAYRRTEMRRKRERKHGNREKERALEWWAVLLDTAHTWHTWHQRQVMT